MRTHHDDLPTLEAFTARKTKSKPDRAKPKSKRPWRMHRRAAQRFSVS